MERATPASITTAWRALEAALEARDPRLRATLQPGARHVKDYWNQVNAFFAAHDGQKPRARPLFDGFRLISYAENERAFKRFRGDMYRRDWNDEWVVIGIATPVLLCWDPAKDIVWIVDTAKEPYEKRKRCMSVVKWLELAADSLGG